MSLPNCHYNRWEAALRHQRPDGIDCMSARCLAKMPPDRRPHISLWCFVAGEISRSATDIPKKRAEYSESFGVSIDIHRFKCLAIATRSSSPADLCTLSGYSFESTLPLAATQHPRAASVGYPNTRPIP